MLFQRPAYYDKFLCLADKCPDNCCIGWEIQLDEITAELYRALGGELGNRLRQCISEDNCFILENDCCPMLEENGLCRIIKEQGKGKLCQICRDHPRYFEWFSQLKEGGLGLSCPEAARLILTSEDNSLICDEINEEGEQTDEELFELLYSFRQRLFELMANTGLSLRERLYGMLCLARPLQQVLDNPTQELCREEILPCSDGNPTDFMSLFGELEPINELWRERLDDTLTYTKSYPSEAFSRLSQTEEQYLARLAAYFIHRYLLKACFDSEVLSRISLAVASVIAVRLMVGDKHNLSDYIEAACLYSKQLEYSEDNLELFRDMCYDRRELSCEYLWALLK